MLDFLFQKGGFLFLIDALNEVSQDSVKQMFFPLLSGNARNRILFASQSDVLQRPQTRVCTLNATSPTQAKQYLEKCLGHDVWDDLPIEARRLAESPQNLALLAEVLISTDPKQVPVHRADLYRSIFEKDSAMESLRVAGGNNLYAVYEVSFKMIEDVRFSVSPGRIALICLLNVVQTHHLCYPPHGGAEYFREEMKRNLARN